jgi:hypothetical protein
MQEIEVVRVLPGAAPFNARNFNDTYTGQFLLKDKTTRHGYIKDVNKQQLVNEILAFLLGRELGLPIPDSYVGFVKSGDLSVTKMPMSNRSGHVVFVSADVGVPSLVQRYIPHGELYKLMLVNELKKWVHLGATYAFDTWIANTDRNEGNLLIEDSTKIWLIDHGHAFTGHNWKDSDFLPLTKYRNRLSEWLTKYLTSDFKIERSKDANACAAKLNQLPFTDHVKSIHGMNLLSDSESDALRNFLSARVTVVSLQSKEALGVPSMVA